MKDLKDFEAAGCFVDDAPVNVPGEWKGHTFDVWVVRPSFADAERLSHVAADTSAGRAFWPTLVSQYVRLGSEKSEIPIEMARRMEPSFGRYLLSLLDKALETPKS